MSRTLADLGEFGLIRLLQDRLPNGKDVLLGPGDDAAIVHAIDGRVVATTDMLVEGRHFRRDWSEAYDIGRKAAAQNLADVAAMGARPTALLVALAAPPDLEVDWALGLADGLRDECERTDASVAGGDLVRGPSIVISVTALGSLDGRPPVTRAGAKAGDVIAVCGRLGWSAAGLAVLGRGFRSPRVVVEAHRRPEPPYDAGPEAATLGATAMIDVSDGLVGDLGHIAKASDVVLDLDTKSLEIAEPLQAVAAAIGVDPLEFVLTGGEDHALAATFPSEVNLPERWRVIGRVAAPTEEQLQGVTINGEKSETAGHDHFR
ncbi:thiamine-phosphate kinase [Tenggerimyces flavus]|uniref:Thiamine-monophosphate kinase n=1 Tax=Tenggerimyces flavus TaxID=1708749 RepID=A0ABV7Y994_9ACTN|nr:thiamine-phosphate kinase [Tenggerimyces flavus]MBM7786651.1 thiamine-monophosphate kinase [Tenggerimyces flavus]